MSAYIPVLAGFGPGGVVLETAVCELDTQGRVRRWGAAAQRVFGVTEEQAVGQILPMVPFDMREETLTRVREAASGAMCGEHSTVWYRDDGEPLEV